MSDEYDIVHSWRDERVNYNDPKAQYRIYINLENCREENVKIKDCEKFEN